MTIDIEPKMKKSLKRYAQFWVGGLTVAMKEDFSKFLPRAFHKRGGAHTNVIRKSY